MQEFTAIAAALAIGLSLGLIGAGGSILTIPVFVYILKIDPLSSSIYSMFVVGISSLAGGIQAMVNKLVDWKIAGLFGIPSMAGVWVARKCLLPAVPERLFSTGSWVIYKETLFMLCLAALMLLSAMRMLQPPATNDRHAEHTSTGTGSLMVRGLLVGTITGLLGIGGGFLTVPALYFWAGLPVKKSIGTALVLIATTCLFSFWSAFDAFIPDWNLLMKFSLIAVAGIIIGTRLSARIPAVYLKKSFGWFILVISFYMIYKTIASNCSAIEASPG